jgi:hypothetical protein
MLMAGTASVLLNGCSSGKTVIAQGIKSPQFEKQTTLQL